MGIWGGHNSTHNRLLPQVDQEPKDSLHDHSGIFHTPEEQMDPGCRGQILTSLAGIQGQSTPPLIPLSACRNLLQAVDETLSQGWVSSFIFFFFPPKESEAVVL